MHRILHQSSRGMEKKVDPAGAFLFVSIFGGVFLLVLVQGRASHRGVFDPLKRGAKEGGRFVKEFGCVRVDRSRTMFTEVSFVIYENRKSGHQYVVMDWLQRSWIASSRKTVRLTSKDGRRLLKLLDEAAMVGVVQ